MVTRLRRLGSGALFHLGAWLIRQGVQLDPEGGGGIVAISHGTSAWARCWHRGLVAHAAIVAHLASEESKVAMQHAAVLDEIDEMTER